MFIFDEATSALDKNNEKSVQQAINRIHGVTVVVIAHRLSTVRNADKILVMGKGELKEEGSHDELLKKYPDGVYAKLVENEQKLASQEAEESPERMKEAALEDVKIGNIEYDEKMEEANKILEEKNRQLEEKLKPLTDPKKQDKFFRQQLWQYNKPLRNIVFGGFVQVLNGVIGPVSGMFIIKCIFSMVMFASDADKKNA